MVFENIHDLHGAQADVLLAMLLVPSSDARSP